MERSRNRDDRDDDRGSRRSSRDDDSRSSRGGRDSGDDDRSSRRSSRDDDDRGERSSSRSGGRSSFQYQGRTADQMKKRGAMRGKEFDRFVREDIKTWVPKDGVNIVRILPAGWKNPEHYGLDIYVHYGVGADRQSFLDLDKMKGEADPISEEYTRAKKEGDEEYAKQLDSKRRCGVFIIDRDAEKEGPQFWAMPWTIDADVNKLSVDKRTGEALNIDDPQDGYDLEFEKTGKGKNTKYEGVAIARRSSELGDDRWLDYVVENPIPEILVYYDYDHIAKAFGGGGMHRDDDRGSRESGRDRDSGRSSSRDDDRGSRRSSRDDDKKDDDRSSRSSSREPERSSRDRDDDRGSSRSRSSREEPVLSWESIHEMTGDELDALIEQEGLDINPDKADSDEDLADWICEEMKLKKSESKGRSRLAETPKEEPDDRAKLRRMREDRDRR